MTVVVDGAEASMVNRAGLALLSFAAAATVAVTVPRLGFGAAAVDSPMGIRGPGACLVVAQNLDPDLPARATTVLHKQGGQGMATLPLPPLPPLAGHAMDLATLPELSLGAFAAALRADQALASVSECRWFGSGGDGWSNTSTPGTEVVVPLAQRLAAGENAILSIQNTDPNRPTGVELALMALDGKVRLEQRYEAGPGTSITLDLVNNPDFDGLPQPFTGWALVRSSTDTPLAVQSFVDLESSQRGIYSFEGVPAVAAGYRLLAPRVHRRMPLDPGRAGDNLLSSRLALVNVGPEAATVAVRYRGQAGTCAGQTFDLRHVAVPLSGGVVIRSGLAANGSPDLPDPLSDGCTASAEIQSEHGRLVGVVADVAIDASGNPALASAYRALAEPELSSQLALPSLRRAVAARSSSIHVLNAGPLTATATLTLTEPGGNTVACGAPCRVQIPAGAGQTWSLDDLTGTTDGLWYSARLQADQPLAAVVRDLPLADTWDLASYAGVRIGEAVPGALLHPIVLSENCPALMPSPTEVPVPTATHPPRVWPGPYRLHLPWVADEAGPRSMLR
jgi:hypothetical protein